MNFSRRCICRRFTPWPRCRNAIPIHIVETPQRGVSTFPLNLEVRLIVVNWSQDGIPAGGHAGHVNCNHFPLKYAAKVR